MRTLRFGRTHNRTIIRARPASLGAPFPTALISRPTDPSPIFGASQCLSPPPHAPNPADKTGAENGGQPGAAAVNVQAEVKKALESKRVEFAKKPKELTGG